MYIDTCSQTLQIGYLLACISTRTGSFCLMQALEFARTENGLGMFNKYDCPLLKSNKKVLTVKSVNVLTDLSILHHCSESCRFIEEEEDVFVERDRVTKSNLVLQHDTTNSYYLNIYALSYKCS